MVAQPWLNAFSVGLVWLVWLIVFISTCFNHSLFGSICSNPSSTDNGAAWCVFLNLQLRAHFDVNENNNKFIKWTIRLLIELFKDHIHTLGSPHTHRKAQSTRTATGKWFCCYSRTFFLSSSYIRAPLRTFFFFSDSNVSIKRCRLAHSPPVAHCWQLTFKFNCSLRDTNQLLL